MTDATQLAIARAKAQFELHLVSVGVSAAWKQRAANAATSSGTISQALGREDPSDSDFLVEVADTQVYTSAGTLLVLKDTPALGQPEEAGMMLEGLSRAHVSADSAVAVADVLVIGGMNWVVQESRLATPPIFCVLLLRREGFA